MTQPSNHPYHGIIGRREITTDLRERLGYPINPDIYAIFFKHPARPQNRFSDAPPKPGPIPSASS